MINNKQLETVDEYTYLGVKNFLHRQFGRKAITDKRKSFTRFYSLTRYVDLKKLTTKYAIKLFETMVVPILSYGCEI